MEENTVTTESTSTETTTEMGTTARLFGEDLFTSEPTAKPAAIQEENKTEKPRDEKGKFVSAEKNPAAEPVSNASEYLSVEDFGDKKVKVKIDGKDKEVTGREMWRAYQTDQYLSQKGQRIAEEFKQLQAMKGTQEAQPKSTPTESKSTETNDEFYNEYIRPYMEKESKERERLAQELNSLKTVLGPVQYQANLKRLESEMTTSGFDDFAKYIPEIEKTILNMPIEQQIAFDTDMGYKSIFKDMKLAEYKSASKKKEETKLPDQRLAPKIVNIEGGTGASTGTDETNTKLDRLFKKAQESGRTADWTEYTKAKFSG